MDFLLWMVRSLHLFSVVVWLGGLLYQAVVTYPVAKAEQIELAGSTLHMMRRFLPFVWMSVWTMLVTGICLMLFSPRFVLFEFGDRWSVILALKQLTFIVMAFFSFGYARMFSRLEEMARTAGGGEELALHRQRMLQFGRINVALAILGLLLASGMK